MGTLIFLSSVLLYILVGATVGQVKERLVRKRCNEYYHNYCDHVLVSTAFGVFWPFVPPIVLVFLAGKNISTTIADFFVKED